MSDFRRRTVIAKKPYDAEIEYLESDGTQYIDLGFKGNLATTIDIDFFCPKDTYIRVFGARSDWNRNAFQLSYGALGDYRASFSYDNISVASEVVYDVNLYDGQWHNAKSNGNGHRCVDGINRTNTCSAFTTPYNIILFGFNNNGTILIGNIRIRKCKINDLDLIPVRKGGVGYMYDRVSGELFGNSGTGNFILGPDL